MLIDAGAFTADRPRRLTSESSDCLEGLPADARLAAPPRVLAEQLVQSAGQGQRPSTAAVRSGGRIAVDDEMKVVLVAGRRNRRWATTRGIGRRSIPQAPRKGWSGSAGR